MSTIETKAGERREYRAPKLNKWGDVADITRVGQTTPGDDTFVIGSGRDGGSINPPGEGNVS